VCADLVRIWQSEKKTILFVTHDIEEAVQLADRVLVMSNRPATIQEVVDVDLLRPPPGFARLPRETRPHLSRNRHELAGRRNRRVNRNLKSKIKRALEDSIWLLRPFSPFELRHSFVIRHSSFVILT
jgi:ABC-type nitrate/sulfonate/bicarbonate transport system ATPase subunit